MEAVAAEGGVHNNTTVTWRGLRHLGHFLQHPLPSLEHLLAPLDSDHRAVLELGCGEGRALLDLQLRYPRAQCYCLNSKARNCKRQDSSRSQSRGGLCNL